MVKDGVEIAGGSVIKRGTREAVVLEAARTGRALEIASATGLFQIPRVLGCEAGVLELERIGGIEPMQKLVAYAPASLPVWPRLGRILAAIHAYGAGRDPESWTLGEPLPPEWRSEGAASVWIHGDFDPGNIFYRKRDDRIVVLDWAVSPMLGALADVGPRYFDAAFFMSGVFFLARRYVWHRQIGEKLGLFIGAYEAESGQGLDRTVLGEFMMRAGRLRLERQARSAIQRMCYRRALARLGRFVECDLT